MNIVQTFSTEPMVCEHCHWRGTNPSSTERKVETIGDDGALKIRWQCIAVCPRCYSFVKRETPEGARA